MASAGPYASLHLAPYRQPRQYPTTLFFYRPDALPAAQPTASKHWRHNINNKWQNKTINYLNDVLATEHVVCSYFWLWQSYEPAADDDTCKVYTGWLVTGTAGMPGGQDESSWDIAFFPFPRRRLSTILKILKLKFQQPWTSQRRSALRCYILCRSVVLLQGHIAFSVSFEWNVKIH